MKFHEEEYLIACRQILDYGIKVEDRTGVGTIMDTNVMIEHTDVERYFPLPVTKKLAVKSMIGELLWFLEGSTSDRRLAEITYDDGDHKTIWTANWEAKPYRLPTTSMSVATRYDGPRELGPVYGKQWRQWGRPNRSNYDAKSREIDQLVEVINRIKRNPHDRRLVVSAWNPSDVRQMSLPPCHMIFQFNVRGDHLDLAMFQRSGDMFLGVPFNIASYALLLKLIAKETEYRAGKLSILIGNAHIYLNHVDQVKEQLSRAKSFDYESLKSWYFHPDDPFRNPQIVINTDSQLFNPDGSIGYTLDDFQVTNYMPLSVIKAPMAV